jgi:hypothetical protein
MLTIRVSILFDVVPPLSELCSYGSRFVGVFVDVVKRLIAKLYYLAAYPNLLR